METRRSSYQAILKATTLFGSVQVFGILISMVRSKAIALLIGASGIGVLGLMISALNLISSATGLGLETGGVREMALHSEDENKRARSIGILRYVGRITAAVAALLTIGFSFALSDFAFGSTGNAIWFCWLGLAILFKQLTTAELAILQGLKRHRHLAKANLFGSLFGLLAALPMFYFLGIDGVVYGLVVNSVLVFVFSRRFVPPVASVKMKAKSRFNEARPLMKLGFYLSLTAVISNLSAYLVQIFVTQAGNLHQAGLYSAAMTLLNSYVGIVFTAMATDYFPRLSAVSEDNIKMGQIARDQAEVGILVITPIIVIFLMSAPLVISILYTKEFNGIVPFLRIGIIGMLFRTASWSMGYLLLAKGESRLFLKTGLLFNSIFLALNFSGYYWFGLIGIGYAFTVHYLIHMIGLALITRKKYNFIFGKGFLALFAICLLLCLTAFAGGRTDGMLRHVLHAISLVATIAFCGYHLNRKAGIFALARRFLKRK